METQLLTHGSFAYTSVIKIFVVLPEMSTNCVWPTGCVSWSGSGRKPSEKARGGRSWRTDTGTASVRSGVAQREGWGFVLRRVRFERLVSAPFSAASGTRGEVLRQQHPGVLLNSPPTRDPALSQRAVVSPLVAPIKSPFRLHNR